MPSPFPGMDPYLEAHWRDVHAALVIYTRDALQNVLPAPLRARAEERVMLEAWDGMNEAVFYPDLRIVEASPEAGRPKRSARTSTGAVAEPIIVKITREPSTERFIQIIDTSSGNRVVTIIEFLSPANKEPGRDFDRYRYKQQQVLQSETSLVEINLNRMGMHVLAVPLEDLNEDLDISYLACVSRSWDRQNAEVYSMPLHQRLPALKIPLRPTDRDVALDLQALINRCYRNGGYEGTLDYTKNPYPPLNPVQAAWADALLRKKGLRPGKKPAAGRKRKSR